VTSAGCQRSPSPVAPAEPPALPVSKPVERQVTSYVDFTGRTDAVNAVDIRPRVTGYLVKCPSRKART
jgi:multidrug efflux system membrane fusion protein